ncbi:hypothetical protein LAZ67_15000720 [Cordylochernes scorpioides]|uniref:Ig-like domain-containing protein n=1 Tax=Cordylochernes scorpioides TaxID=51811 RepID=A0ABY6LD19_9ARAC|nr:hypothetical protein LAZ67_15000720 [Cordylochernes scorpioides]
MAPILAKVQPHQRVQVTKRGSGILLPRHGPHLEGLKQRYLPGEEFNATCWSSPSKPAATLRWYINDQPALPSQETRTHPVRHSDGLQSTRVRLHFRLDGEHFQTSGGLLKVHCQAAVAQVYSSTSEELVLRDRISRQPPVGPPHTMEAVQFNIRVLGFSRPAAKSDILVLGFSAIYPVQENGPHLIPSVNRPTISGQKKRYEIGDLVDLNCTSAKYRHQATLKWYINDVEVGSD